MTSPGNRLRIERLHARIENQKALRDPLKNRSKTFTIKLHCHREKKRVSTRRSFPHLSGANQRSTKFVDVVLLIFVVFPFKPKLRFRCFVDEQPLLFKTVLIERKSILVANPIQNKSEFKFCRFARRVFVQFKWCVIDRTIGRIDRRLPNQCLRELHREHKRRLATRVRAVDHRRAQKARWSRPSIDCISVRFVIVFARRHAQTHIVSDRTKIFDTKLYKHIRPHISHEILHKIRKISIYFTCSA